MGRRTGRRPTISHWSRSPMMQVGSCCVVQYLMSDTGTVL